MDLQSEQIEYPADFRRKSTLALAITALLILTPFSINNFLHERYLLGAGSLAIVGILVFIARTISRGRYSSLYILICLVPAILFFLSLAIQKQGIVGVMWCYPAILSFYMMLPERKAWIANAALLCVAIPFIWIGLDLSLATRATATLITVSVFSIILIRIITGQQKKLHDHAIKDPLTGLLNRTLLESLLEQSVEQNKRTGIPMTLLAIDIDHFKSINDKHGHDSGDMVLRVIGELLRKRVRSIDRVFRLGGEEFLAFLFGTDTTNGRTVAEEIRNAIASLQALPGSNITVSIGVATLQPGENRREWMKRSDENLYCAKREGRNQVMG